MLAIWEHHLTELLDLVGILNEIRSSVLHRLKEFTLSDRRDMDRLLTNAGDTIVIRAIGDNHPCHVCKVVIIIAQNLLAIALTDTEAGTAAGINSLDHTRATGGDIHIALSQQFIRGLDATVLRLNDLNQISRSPQCLNLFANQIHRLQ